MNSRNAFRFIPVVSAVVAASILSTAACAADRADSAPTVTVRYSAADLADSSAAQNLYTRIRSAARTVCDTQGRSIEEQRASENCYRNAVDAAVANIHSPMLDQTAVAML